MRTSTRLKMGLIVASAFAFGSIRGLAQPAAKTCPNDQSPRRLADFGSLPSFDVARASAGLGDAVTYIRFPDRRQWLLKRCGQHYHCHVENVQPLCGQSEATGECGFPTPDSWVEVHTLYAQDVATVDCDPEETPGCCRTRGEGDPILVMAYHAKVKSEGPPLLPIPLPWGFETARWSGSTTGTKPPLDCKPAAQWNFMLGCDFTVSQPQLRLFHRIEQARRLQTQLSPDLAYKAPR